MRSLFTVLLITLVCSVSLAQEAAPPPVATTEGVQLTVYNDNLAVVKDRRRMAIPEGQGLVKFSDVAAQIDATSVHFESLSDPIGTQVLEQNYEYDLVNPTKLLDKYLDKEVMLLTKDQAVYTGTLLSQAEGRVILRDGEGKLQVVTGGENLLKVELAGLPEGLITKPTLVWQTYSANPGNQLCQVTYMTAGVSWKADYVMVVNDKDTEVDLTGWVTLDNQSGATYKDARLKLIAGDVHRAPEPRPMMKRMRADSAVLAMEAAAPQFEEKAFFEYHLYTLQRPTTVGQAQTKQVQLLAAADIPAKKIFIYDGSRTGKKVEVKVEFKNSTENHMGMPLPKGRVRAFKADSDGSLEFIGEDQIDHTPKDEQLRILLGNAFDIVGERNQLDHREVSRVVSEDTWEIKLRNHKQETVTVTVSEPQWGDWKVIKSSHPGKKKDAKTLEIPVDIPADGEVVITYTVQIRS